MLSVRQLLGFVPILRSVIWSETGVLSADEGCKQTTEDVQRLAYRGIYMYTLQVRDVYW